MTLFVQDSFSGTGLWSTHVGELGASWSAGQTGGNLVWASVGPLKLDHHYGGYAESGGTSSGVMINGGDTFVEATFSLPAGARYSGVKIGVGGASSQSDCMVVQVQRNVNGQNYVLLLTSTWLLNATLFSNSTFPWELGVDHLLRIQRVSGQVRVFIDDVQVGTSTSLPWIYPTKAFLMLYSSEDTLSPTLKNFRAGSGTYTPWAPTIVSRPVVFVSM